MNHVISVPYLIPTLVLTSSMIAESMVSTLGSAFELHLALGNEGASMNRVISVPYPGYTEAKKQTLLVSRGCTSTK